jgi:hypothetical protein
MPWEPVDIQLGAATVISATDETARLSVELSDSPPEHWQEVYKRLATIAGLDVQFVGRPTAISVEAVRSHLARIADTLGSIASRANAEYNTEYMPKRNAQAERFQREPDAIKKYKEDAQREADELFKPPPSES